MDEKNKIIEEILRLKKEKNAIILAHNYELPEIQDIADFVGDSLGLSQQAAKTDADIIVFCGVHFMAETASIISPNKKVLIPDPEAGCSLADSITVEQLREWKKEHPEAIVVSYVNTTAEIKAESDYCVTSGNAIKVINAIPKEKKILFLPDQFLGKYVETVTGRKMEIWKGACHVHKNISETDLLEAIKKYPGADVLIHPECSCSASCLVKSHLYEGCNEMKIFSTEGMVNFVHNSHSKHFVIATEVGILNRLKKDFKTKNFYPVNENSVCEYMKKITYDKVLLALKEEKYEVKVTEFLAKRASISIDRMLEIC